MEDSSNIQALVDCFDEIPDMMNKIKTTQPLQGRFHRKHIFRSSFLFLFHTRTKEYFLCC